HRLPIVTHVVQARTTDTAIRSLVSNIASFTKASTSRSSPSFRSGTYLPGADRAGLEMGGSKSSYRSGRRRLLMAGRHLAVAGGGIIGVRRIEILCVLGGRWNET